MQPHLLAGQAPPTVRIDKIKHHENHVAHNRAIQKWTAFRRAPAPAPAVAEGPDAAVPDADAPLAALLRTVLTAAAAKVGLSLVQTLVQLQVANATVISTSHSSSTHGVQTLLHAAAVLLQQQQNERLQQAGMLSDMGDGSSDRKTIEQEILYVRYPT